MVMYGLLWRVVSKLVMLAAVEQGLNNEFWPWGPAFSIETMKHN